MKAIPGARRLILTPHFLSRDARGPTVIGPPADDGLFGTGRWTSIGSLMRLMNSAGSEGSGSPPSPERRVSAGRPSSSIINSSIIRSSTARSGYWKGRGDPIRVREQQQSRGSSRRNRRGSEHDPGVGKDCVVVVRVAAGTVEVGGSTIELIPQRVLQSDAHVQPWPEGGAAVAERQVGDFRNPAGAVRAAGECAVKRCVCGAADRHPTRRKAPGVVVDVGSRDVKAAQRVVGIVGEPERLARARVMVLVNPGDTSSDSMGITEILILGIDADIGERIVAGTGHPHRGNL